MYRQLKPRTQQHCVTCPTMHAPCCMPRCPPTPATAQFLTCFGLQQLLPHVIVHRQVGQQEVAELQRVALKTTGLGRRGPGNTGALLGCCCRWMGQPCATPAPASFPPVCTRLANRLQRPGALYPTHPPAARWTGTGAWPAAPAATHHTWHRAPGGAMPSQPPPQAAPSALAAPEAPCSNKTRCIHNNSSWAWLYLQ